MGVKKPTPPPEETPEQRAERRKFTSPPAPSGSSDPYINSLKSEIADLQRFKDTVGGYFCVFTGRPHLCTPYAAFATETQAEIFAETIGRPYQRMTVEEWIEQRKLESIKDDQ